MNNPIAFLKNLFSKPEEVPQEPEIPVPFEPDEKELMVNIRSLRELVVADVMVPRCDIIAASSEISYEDLLKLFGDHRLSFIPVYQETLDNMVGGIQLKDLIHWLEKKEPFVLQQLLCNVPFISPSMRTLDLLLHMRQTGYKQAIVVDEYGGIDGLVTFGDLIEEIIGDIRDAHGKQPLQKKAPDGSVIVDARTSLEEIEQLFRVPFMYDALDEEANTLGGLAIALADSVPLKGTILKHPNGFEIEVLEADPRRVKLLALRQKHSA